MARLAKGAGAVWEANQSRSSLKQSGTAFQCIAGYAGSAAAPVWYVLAPKTQQSARTCTRLMMPSYSVVFLHKKGGQRSKI